jgi:alcohol dehydrogenase (cytochrome c)
MTARRKYPETESSRSPRRERRAFTEEFKREAVRLLHHRRAAGVSVTQIGRELDVRPGQLRVWARRLAKGDGLLYTSVVDICATFTTDPQKFKESLPYWGSGATADAKIFGAAVKTFDPTTGREIWASPTKHPVVSSLLTTAGGIVFAGESTGEFDAFDTRTGKLLWQFNTGSGIHGSAISYSVNGKQYIAIPSGWRGWMKGFAPELDGENRGNALIVFALP